MKIFGMSLKDRLGHIDPTMFICTTFLSLVSILTIYGAMENFGRIKLTMQLAMTAAGIFAIFVIANIDYKFFVDRFAIIMFIGSALILALTLVVGSTGENMDTANKSWLEIPIIGIAVQPSEFVKITFVCTFAKHIDLVKDKINKPKYLLGLAVHAGVIVGLILLSGDLGVALVYMAIVAIMLFLGGLSIWYFVGLGGAVACAAPFLWDLLKPYQQNRIIYGFQPELDPNGVGQQALLSRQTMISGGFFGKGLFGGENYEILAASHTDFIFATICEKFGYLGGFIVVLTFVVLVIRLIYIAMRSRDTMGKLICAGVATMIAVQTSESLWMCIGRVPVVGITLPFLSAGGSSLFALYVIFGIAHSAYAHEKRYFFS